MKFCAAVMLWLATVLWGIGAAARLKKREALFGKLSLIPERILIEFEYLSSSLPSVLESISEDTAFSDLSFIADCRRRMAEGEAFPSAWRESVFSCGLPLDRKEKERLAEIACALGSSDIAGQRRILSMYIGVFGEMHRESKEKLKKNACLWVTGSAFVGCMLFVLII